MDYKGKKRQRCISFSGEEKLFIANICAKYKHILENKKTDQISSDEKNRTWEKIASEVNAAAVNGTHRSSDFLKRFYENRKREVRKIAAEEKKEILATGGGQPVTFKKDTCHDIILSIMNPKTIYGLENELDGDAEPLPSFVDSNTSNPEGNVQPCNDVEIVYELNDNEQGTSPWKKYIPADLKQPITPNLLSFQDDQKPGPSSFKRKMMKKQMILHIQKKSNTLPTSRRRPMLNVKALTRSELAEKYDELLNKRLEIADYQKKKIKEEMLTIEGERKLKFQLLELQIEVEKEKLRQLKKE